MTVNLTMRPRNNGELIGQTYDEWLTTWVEPIGLGHDFDAPSMRGRSLKFGLTGYGELTSQHPAFVKAIRPLSQDITYVIYSYDTPIAMWLESGDGCWIIPKVKFRSPDTNRVSQTTGGHQARIRHIVDSLGERVVSTVDEIENIPTTR